MTTVQEQYGEVLQQGQQAVLNSVNAWNKTFQETVGSWATTPGRYAPEQVVDQVYDFAGKVLESQRELVKTVWTTTAQATETFAARAQAAANGAVHQASEG